MPAKVNKDKCKGCKDCVSSCPTEAISMDRELAVVDETICVDCGACVEACPEGAITVE